MGITAKELVFHAVGAATLGAIVHYGAKSFNLTPQQHMLATGLGVVFGGKIADGIFQATEKKPLGTHSQRVLLERALEKLNEQESQQLR